MLIITKEENIIELRSGRMALNHGRWTDKDRDFLADMYATGVDMTDIALILRRSERAITTQIDKMGLRERSRASWSKKDGCLCYMCSMRGTLSRKSPCEK